MEEKKDYLRVLKHDIKGPLTVIQGYLSFWEGDAYTKFPPEKQKEFILKALEGTRRMKQAIEDTFVKIYTLQEEGKLNSQRNDKETQ